MSMTTLTEEQLDAMLLQSQTEGAQQAKTNETIQMDEDYLDSLLLQSESGLNSAMETAKETVGQINIIPTAQDLDTERGVMTPQQRKIQEEKEYMQTLSPEQLQNYKLEGIADPGLESPFLDPTLAPLEAAIGTGIIKGAEKLIDKVQWPKPVKEFFSKLTDDEREVANNSVEFMSKLGIVPTDINLKGGKGNDLSQYLTGGNLFAVREAFENQKILSDGYIKTTETILQKIKRPTANTGSWRDMKPFEDVITSEVNKLRQSYKKIEGDMYSKVTEIAKSDKSLYKIDSFSTNLNKALTTEGVPTESANVVYKILDRFKKPFKDEQIKLAANAKARQKLMVDIKKNRLAQKEALSSGDDAKALKLEAQREKLVQGMKDIDANSKELRDVKYMSTTDLLNSIKLINRKIYKPGGSISIKDADELRGLQIAKAELEKFLEQNAKSPELQKALRDAKDVTIVRTGLFGAKDSGGEKLMLANLLDRGNWREVTEAMTGPSAKENIAYIRDVFGKDSEAFKASFGLYLNNKLGLSPEKVQSILQNNKVFGAGDSVDIRKAAHELSKLDSDDFNMIANVSGKQAVLDMRSLQKIMANYADLEDAAEKYGRGITGGKRAYITGGQGILSPVERSMKLIKDSLLFYSAKTAEKMIVNQPKFRTVTGAAAGATVYMANTEQEDLTLEGAIMSAIVGGTAGYYGGRATRSLLESDVKKVVRYLKTGRSRKEMPADVRKSFERIGETQGGSTPKYLRDELTPKTNQMPVPSSTPSAPAPQGRFADEYDNFTAPAQIGR